jgi:putative oxidoreductase
MHTLIYTHEALAVFIARVFLGLLFFFQGYDAVFKVRIKNVIETVERPFEEKGIPRFLTVGAAWFTSCSELIGGLLLIVGLFEPIAFLMLGANILVASIGFGITNPVWDLRHVFPRLVLLLFLLLVPASWDVWSLDHFVNYLKK